ncbi:MAG: ATP-dependent Clp protease adaptor protein ClpS, partial [uncultured Rubrobacteraceae bacterium]
DGYHHTTPGKERAKNGGDAPVQRSSARRRRSQLRVRDLHAEDDLRASTGEGLPDGYRGRYERPGRRCHHQSGAGRTQTRPDPRFRFRPTDPALQRLDVGDYRASVSL